MHPFKAFISMHTQIGDEDWSKIKPCLKHRIVQAGRVILKPGKICDSLYFLENGAIRYFVQYHGERETTYEIQPPYLFTSVQSFIHQQPSNEGIQAIEESYIWVVSRDDVQRLLEIPSWKNFMSNL